MIVEYSYSPHSPISSVGCIPAGLLPGGPNLAAGTSLVYCLPFISRRYSRIAIIPPVRVTLSGCNSVVATADGVGMRRRFLINILLPLSFFPKNAAPTISRLWRSGIRY
nr:hypothetical protein [Solanum melongena]WMB97084.1 hypothetical protein [Solanum aethiopicum]